MNVFNQLNSANNKQQTATKLPINANYPANQMQCFEEKKNKGFLFLKISSEGLHKINESVCDAFSAISVDSKLKSESFGVILGIVFEK